MENETASARFEIVPDDRMPDGQVLVQIDTSDETVMAVREGHMSPELQATLNQHLQHLTQHGIWEKSRRDGPQPPRLRRAS